MVKLGPAPGLEVCSEPMQTWGGGAGSGAAQHWPTGDGIRISEDAAVALYVRFPFS